MTTRVHIGDVILVPDHLANPYHAKGETLCGEPRKALLRAFARGEPTPGYRAWYAPFCGGARLIDREEVNWETSGLKGI